MPVVDIGLNPRGVKEGAEQVKRAFGTIKDAGKQALELMEQRGRALRSLFFSIKAAIVALAIAEFTREMINLSLQFERAERGLRGVVASAQDARLAFARIQDIGDKFQLLPDVELANSFRLLTSYGIPQAEKAMETIANVAVLTGNSVNAVTNAVIAGQERMLRQLGIQLIDLGQGEVDLIFGNMELRVKKTEENIRKGLLQLMSKGFPDATKEMGDSMEFQFKRVGDKYELLQQSIMREGGLQTFLTTMAKKIADAFDDEKVRNAGAAVGRGIIIFLEFLGKAAAFTLDVIVKVYDNILKLYNLLERLGIFKPELYKESANRLLIAPGAIGLAVEGAVKLGKKFGAFDKDPNLQKSLEDPLNLGDANKARADAEKSYSEAFNEWIVEFKKDYNKAQKELMEMKDRKSRGEGPKTVGAEPDSSKRIIDAQIAQLAKDTDRVLREEAEKRDVLFRPEKAEAYGQALDYIRSREMAGLTVTKLQADAIKELFAAQGKARESTRQWTEEMDINNQAIERRNQFLNTSINALRTAQDETAKLARPEGLQRREEEIRLDMIRQIETQRIPINEDVLKLIELMPKALAEQERHNATLLDQERKRRDNAERLAAINDEIADINQGLTGGQSFTTRLNAAQREAERNQVDFDAVAEGARISAEMDAERARTIANVNRNLEREFDITTEIIQQAGKLRNEREAELAYLNKKREIEEAHGPLGAGEALALRNEYKKLQEQKQLQEDADAFNRFVDSFEVGWQQIERMGEQAYQHLEDALLKFIQTGKLNFSTFVDYVSQELMRLGMRALISQAFGAVGGSYGFGSLFSSGLGSAVSGAGASQLFSGNAGASSAALRGITTPGAYGPGFREGGVFDYSGRSFKSYYNIPGAQDGIMSYNERLLRVSEGHKPEAVIPLKGGKVPVQMGGWRGMTIHAPITIISPDANGVRRSEQQIQASMSSALLRASRRYN